MTVRCLMLALLALISDQSRGRGATCEQACTAVTETGGLMDDLQETMAAGEPLMQRAVSAMKY